MSGPHAIWSDDHVSDVKRARVTSPQRRTLADLATGRGSLDLRRRVAAIIRIEISPARRNFPADPRQLEIAETVGS